ncbi:MAG: hypothetical protein R2912_05180 [Eubacteriales bacterium]
MPEGQAGNDLFGLFLSHVAPYIDLSLLMAVITAAAALLSADETRYQGIVFVLFGLYLFVTAGLLAIGPLMRSVRFKLKNVTGLIWRHHRETERSIRVSS